MQVLVNGVTVSEYLKGLKYKKEIESNIMITEKILIHLKKNKMLYMKLVFIIALAMFHGVISAEVVCAATNVDGAIEKINTLGETLLKLVQTIGYWATLGLTFKDIFEEVVIKGSKHNLGNIIMRGIMLCAAIYYLPELFDFMKSIISVDK